MSINIYHASNDKLEPFDGGMFYSDCPIGTIVPYGGSTIPNGFLLCDGSEVLKTSYSELYSIIGDSFGTASDNTKFVLPDLRESVPVGSGTRGSGVSAHDTYTVGQFKDDQMQNAEGHFTAYSYSDGLAGGAFSSNIDNPDVLMGGTTPTLNFDDFGFNLSNVARTGTTTHGKQLGVNYIIKAAITSLPLDFEDAIDECVKKVDVQSSAISGNNNPISSGGAYIELEKKADKATTLSGYNIDNAYTKDEIDNKISELVTSMTWKPAVATYDDIATTYPNPQEGWTVVTTDTNIAWRYTNGAWIKISANTIPVVTSEVNGLMTSAMLSKLNGIASGAEVNVQSDWTQTNTSADDYIKNKPKIPTKTSDLTNDSGFDSSVVLTKSLAAGATSLTFTNASIGNNSRIIIYTNPYSQGVVTGATQSGTSVTITCAAQSRAYDVSIEIRN
jgi:hypothetical protein